MAGVFRREPSQEGHMRVIARAAVAVLFGYALVAPVHGAATLAFTTIDVPGALLTNAQGVNQQGDVVGGFTDVAGRQHGFLRSGGQFRTIDFPAASSTFARGINDAGDIVGSYQRPGETGGIPAHGFLLTRRGGLLAVDYPGHLNTIPQRILDDGTILGCYHDTDTMGTMHGMMFDRGFSAMDMSMSMNNGATPDGEYVVGLFMDTDGRNKAYVMEHDKLSALEVPGAVFTAGWDVNPSRVVVGVFTESGGATHGFEYDGGAFTRIDAPGATLTRVFGINDRGDLVGQFVDTAGRMHGFVAQVSQ
jgi:probable HAF family extracellular repeat protein